MKNLIKFLIFFLAFQTNAQTPLPSGARFPNATEKTLSEIKGFPAFDENNILNGWINKDSIGGNVDLSNYYNREQTDSLFQIGKISIEGKICNYTPKTSTLQVGDIGGDCWLNDSYFISKMIYLGGDSSDFDNWNILQGINFAEPIIPNQTIDGFVDDVLSYQIEVINDFDNIEITSGTLPDGLSLNESNGLITGTPTEESSASVVVTATNSIGSNDGTLTFNITEEIIGTPIPTPEGFGWEPPFLLLRQEDNSITTNFKKEDYDFENETTVTYYFKPNGNDANNGLTRATPKKSINAVIQALNTTPPAGGATFYLITDVGERFGNAEINQDSGNKPTFPLVIKSGNLDGRPAVLTREDKTGTLTFVSGNVYRWTLSGGTPPVDMTNLDSNGYPIPLVEVASRALCQATPGSWWNSGTGQREFHLFDGRSPIGDSNVIESKYQGILTVANYRLYMENLTFIGSTNTAVGTSTISTDSFRFQKSGATEATVVINDCTFINGFENATFYTNDNTNVILNGIKAAYSYDDGVAYYRYSGSGTTFLNRKAIEIDSFITNSGAVDSGAMNNSTLHHGWSAIRVNGDYLKAVNKNIADIDGSDVWLLGVNANTATGTSANVNISITGNDLWIDSVTVGGATTNLEAISGNVHFKNTIPSWTSTGAATINTY